MRQSKNICDQIVLLTADALIENITQKFEGRIQESPAPEAVRALQGGEVMLLRSIRKIILRDMLERINKH